MGLIQMVKASLRLIKLPEGKLLLAVLLISNGIQITFRLASYYDDKKSNTQCEIKLDKITAEKDTLSFYYTEKIDVIRQEYNKQIVDLLEGYNKKIEKQTEELKEENRIKRKTLKNLRKK